jgi:transposase-like protein
MFPKGEIIMSASIPVVWVKFSAKIKVKNIQTASLAACPLCGEERIQRWGKVELAGSDNENSLRVSRFRCAHCGHTFSDPVKQNLKQTYLETIQAVAGMIWNLGFSLREIEFFFQRLGLSVSRSSIWRHGKRMGLKLDYPNRQDPHLVIDPFYIPGVSEKLGVVVGLVLADGRRVVLGTLPECNPRIVKCYLEDLLVNADVEIEIKGDRAVKSSETARSSCPFVIG